MNYLNEWMYEFEWIEQIEWMKWMNLMNKQMIYRFVLLDAFSGSSHDTVNKFLELCLEKLIDRVA